MSSLFLESSAPVVRTSLADANPVVLIDHSGSTSHRVADRTLLEYCKDRVRSLRLNCRILAFESQTIVVNNLDTLQPCGGTMPSSALPFLSFDDSSGRPFVVVVTDGCIYSAERSAFSRGLKRILPRSCAILCFLTVLPAYALLEDPLTAVERQLNLSIPEALMAVSNNVCVVLDFPVIGRTGIRSRVLAASGAFADVYGVPDFTTETLAKDLPPFSRARLEEVRFGADVPDGFIGVAGFAQPVNTGVLVRSIHAVPTEVLAAISADRTIFSRLPNAFGDAVRRHRSDIDRNEQADAALAALIAAVQLTPSAATADSDNEDDVGKRTQTSEHSDALKAWRAARYATASDDMVRRRRVLATLCSRLAAYEADPTAIALGSNRARRAKEVADDVFDDLDECDCPKFECPITCETAVPCVFVGVPGVKLPNGTDLDLSPTDYALNNPFAWGENIAKSITANPVSYAVVAAVRNPATGKFKDPFSRALCDGFLPLATPKHIVAALSNALCGGREIPQLRLAFLSAAAVLLQGNWPLRDVLEACARQVLLRTTTLPLFDCTSVGRSFGRQPLATAIQALHREVKQRPSALHRRSPADIRAIARVCDVFIGIGDDVLDTGIFRAIAEIHGLVMTFRKRLTVGNFAPEIYDTDKLGFYDGGDRTLKSLVARVFELRRRAFLKGLSFTEILHEVLSDPRYGDLITAAYFGNQIDVPPIAAPEPIGVHFSTTQTTAGLDGDICRLCGEAFADRPSLMQHLRQAYISADGVDHFYSGELEVERAMNSLMKGSSAKPTWQEVFVLAMLRLRHRHGVLHGPLHTRDCREFIEGLAKAATA